MLYGVTLGARYTRKQRYFFATQMKEALNGAEGPKRFCRGVIRSHKNGPGPGGIANHDILHPLGGLSLGVGLDLVVPARTVQGSTAGYGS